MLPDKGLEKPNLISISDTYLDEIINQIEATAGLLDVCSLNSFYQDNQEYYERASCLVDFLTCQQKKMGCF